MKDLYHLLGIERTATPKEIRKAFRSLAKKHHPDAGGDPAKFADISLAHEILMDPDRRLKYDETGDAEESTPNNALADLLQNLGMVFNTVMNGAQQQGIDPGQANLILVMLDILDQADQGIIEQLAVYEKSKALLSRVMGRFEPLDEEQPNHMETIIREQFRQIENQIAPLVKAKELNRKSRTYLQGCEYHQSMSFMISRDR